jgi:hypothetical protein
MKSDHNIQRKDKRLGLSRLLAQNSMTEASSSLNIKSTRQKEGFGNLLNITLENLWGIQSLVLTVSLQVYHSLVNTSILNLMKILFSPCP